MASKSIWHILVLLFSVYCVSNSTVLSGLAGFGFKKLEHEVCEQRVSSDGRTCYLSVKTNVSCVTVLLRTNSCKTHFEGNMTTEIVPTGKPTNWTYLQAYYHRLDGSRRRQGDTGTCAELTQGQCPQYQCRKTCCAGWELDADGQCNKRSMSRCKNGGTYDFRMRVCMCTQGFSGRHCEIALCNGGCEHGGECRPTRSGSNACRCPEHTSGTRCQNIVDCPKCENGGECILDGPLPLCKCPPGFYGKTCTHSFRNDSTCPSPHSPICSDLDCKDECEVDRTCPRGKVCCSDGCCMKCMEPKPRGCWYNGVLHKPQDWFRKNKCTKCVCLSSGSLSCMTFPEDWSRLDVMCCFTNCKVTTTTQRQLTHTSHKPPTLNCSDDVMLVPVTSTSDHASMFQLNIHAKDEDGADLTVHYSPRTLVHNRSPTWSRFFAIVAVSATDRRGHTSVCKQRVAIVDHTPPTFLSCPSDFTATDKEHVHWKVPTASDNVGIRALHTNFKPFQRFLPGHYLVVYTAIDFDNNKAFCQFTIEVTTGDGDIVDNIPPTFLTCPSSLWGTEGVLISWQEPRASDNVGIRSLVSSHDSGSLFSPGITRVVYTATDYSNNIAYCKFNIYVSPKDVTIPDNGHAEKSNMTEAVKITVGTISMLIALLVIVTLVVIIKRRLRSKATNATARPAGRDGHVSVPPRMQIQTISNCLYDGTGGQFNEGFVPTMKPPPYSPASAPPDYEEIESTQVYSTPDDNLPEHPPEYDSLDSRA